MVEMICSLYAAFVQVTTFPIRSILNKVVVIPEPEQHDLQPPNEAVVENEIDSDSTSKVDKVPINADLTHVAHEFDKYLITI